LLSTHGAIKVRWPVSARDIGFMSRWQRACKLETYLANRARMQRLAFYSQTRLHEITETRELSYERSDGYMVLLRSKRELKLVQPGLDVLRAAGTVFHQLDPDEARREPLDRHHLDLVEDQVRLGALLLLRHPVRLA
jgi:D-amino-acid dehydrogenase